MVDGALFFSGSYGRELGEEGESADRSTRMVATDRRSGQLARYLEVVLVGLGFWCLRPGLSVLDLVDLGLGNGWG